MSGGRIGPVVFVIFVTSGLVGCGLGPGGVGDEGQVSVNSTSTVLRSEPAEGGGGEAGEVEGESTTTTADDATLGSQPGEVEITGNGDELVDALSPFGGADTKPVYDIGGTVLSRQISPTMAWGVDRIALRTISATNVDGIDGLAIEYHIIGTTNVAITHSPQLFGLTTPTSSQPVYPSTYIETGGQRPPVLVRRSGGYLTGWAFFALGELPTSLQGYELQVGPSEFVYTILPLDFAQTGWDEDITTGYPIVLDLGPLETTTYTAAQLGVDNCASTYETETTAAIRYADRLRGLPVVNGQRIIQVSVVVHPVGASINCPTADEVADAVAPLVETDGSTEAVALVSNAAINPDPAERGAGAYFALWKISADTTTVTIVPSQYANIEPQISQVDIALFDSEAVRTLDQSLAERDE